MASQGNVGRVPGREVEPERRISGAIDRAYQAERDCRRHFARHADGPTRAPDGEGDYLEPPELEDRADSLGFVEPDESASAFDRDPAGPILSLERLAARVRVPVEFRIVRDGTGWAVRRTGRGQGDLATARMLIAKVVAAYLEELDAREDAEEFRLAERGDWRHLPFLGDTKELLQRVGRLATPDEQRTVHKLLHNEQVIVMAFAVMLPNGDVIVPRVLTYPARKGTRAKRATVAGALRASASRGSDDGAVEIAGEAWSEGRDGDWYHFFRAQGAYRRDYVERRDRGV